MVGSRQQEIGSNGARPLNIGRSDLRRKLPGTRIGIGDSTALDYKKLVKDKDGRWHDPSFSAPVYFTLDDLDVENIWWPLEPVSLDEAERMIRSGEAA